jgi:hypothetical protein
MDRIDAMKVFVAALDEGSLAGAGRTLADERQRPPFPIIDDQRGLLQGQQPSDARPRRELRPSAA